MDCNVERVRFFVEGLVQGRLARAIKLQWEWFLCANCVLSYRLNYRHAMYGSVHRLFLAVFFDCPVRCSSAAVVVGVRVGVEREGAIKVRRAFRRRVMYGEICFDSARAVYCNEAYHQSASQSRERVRFFAHNAGGVLRGRRMAKGARHLRGVGFRFSPFLRFLARCFSVALIHAFRHWFLRVVDFRFGAVRFIVTARFLCFNFDNLLARCRIAIFVLDRLVGRILFYVFLPVSLFYSGVFEGDGDERGQYVVCAVGFRLVAGVRHV